MDTKAAIRSAMDMSQFVLEKYLDDLNDADLMKRPAPGCNHLAWQIGHLIASEVNLLESVAPGKAAKLPDGFAEKHSKDTCNVDDASQFLTKQEYLDQWQKVRAATISALEELPDEKLDAPSPEWIRETFPTVGHMFVLIGNHPMMHAGQFVVVRRQLGKPIVI